MSLFRPQTLTCPNCAQENTVQVAGSINADRRPDLRAAIMGSDFQDMTCERCDERFRVEPELNYLDFGHRQWIAAMPARRMPDFLEVEDDAMESFNRSYGNAASAEAREIGEALDVRLTFGWPALREKLLLRDLGLDDVVMELVKLDLMRRLPEAPLQQGVEMRMVGLEDDRLQFVWLRSGTEELLGEVALGRELYDAIAAERAAWATTEGKLVDGPFVDFQKLFMGEGREAVPA